MGFVAALPWIATAAATVFSALSGKAAADRAADIQADANNVARENLAFQRLVYDREYAFTNPIRSKLAGEYQKDGPLDWSLYRQQVEDNYEKQGRDQDVAFSQHGLTGTPFAAAATEGRSLRKASELSRAWSAGMMTKRQLGLTLAGMGNTQGAAAAVGNASNAYSNGLFNTAGFWNQQSGQAYGAAGNMMGNMAYAWMTKPQTTVQPPPNNPTGLPGGTPAMVQG